MSNEERYQVANSNIIHDTIEDQVILLNLETGTYYQLTQNSVVIWNALVAGLPVSAIEAAFKGKYAGAGDAVDQGIAQFVQELLTEELLAPLTTENLTPTGSPLFTFPNDGNTAFIAPTLLKYTDMQSLLLLDPIHDVDSQGWPVLKPNDSQV